MTKQKTADISTDMLLADGWVKVDVLQDSILFEKKLENRNPINKNPADTDIKLIVHRTFNSPAFAVMFPDGGMLNFVANSMKELKDFENRITFYDCPY